MELSEVEDRLSVLAAESDLCSSGWVASLNEKPHDEHEAASGEISLWQRGQFTGGGLYHRDDWRSSATIRERVSEPRAVATGSRRSSSERGPQQRRRSARNQGRTILNTSQ